MDAYTVDQFEIKREAIKRVKFYIRIRWFLIPALALTGLGTNIALYGYGSLAFRGLLLTAAALLINAIFWALSRAKERGLSYFQGLALAQLLLDVVVFSLAIYAGGGSSGYASSLYIIDVIIAAALFENQVVYLVAGLSWVGLLLADAAGSGHLPQAQQARDVIFQGVVLFISAYLIDVFFGLSRRREAERAHMSIISLTSHQLRTPATAVKGLLSMLLEGEQGLTVEDREIIARAYNENERELALIGNLLEVAGLDMETLQPQPQPIDLSRMVEEAVTYMQPVALKSHQQLEASTPTRPISLLADPDHVRMILDNLLSNALNYSGRGAKIVVRVTRDHGRVLLSVEDNGAGISPSDQKRLFERFSKLKFSHPETTEGAGLGLYIVRKLVELNGGRIDVVSYPKEGSIFTVSLPMGR